MIMHALSHKFPFVHHVEFSRTGLTSTGGQVRNDNLGMQALIYRATVLYECTSQLLPLSVGPDHTKASVAFSKV
jgi:hypothetical protein